MKKKYRIVVNGNPPGVREYFDSLMAAKKSYQRCCVLFPCNTFYIEMEVETEKDKKWVRVD
jgi:hypothetical protein